MVSLKCIASMFYNFVYQISHYKSLISKLAGQPPPHFQWKLDGFPVSLENSIIHHARVIFD